MSKYFGAKKKNKLKKNKQGKKKLKDKKMQNIKDLQTWFGSLRK
jgi:hypothetical protein